MGSQPKTNFAYIAGFLDGDGSLMLQIKHRKDGSRKWRPMCTICFYQDSRCEKPLRWIRGILDIGYISRRKDGITELRINGYHQIKRILEKLLPFIRFKEKQAKALYGAASLLDQKGRKHLNEAEWLRLVDYIMIIQENNYITRRKKTREEVLKILGLTP